MTVSEIHGYALVSEDDKVARRDGTTPQSLMNKEGWLYLQSELDGSALVILGRHTHEQYPNLRRRKRLVLTSSVDGLALKDSVWWWNPARADWKAVVREVQPSGGRLSVIGGAEVTRAFLKIGYDTFHLARCKGVKVPDGRPVFPDCGRGMTADTVLKTHGLHPEPPVMLDRVFNLALTIWRRPS